LAHPFSRAAAFSATICVSLALAACATGSPSPPAADAAGDTGRYPIDASAPTGVPPAPTAAPEPTATSTPDDAPAPPPTALQPAQDGSAPVAAGSPWQPQSPSHPSRPASRKPPWPAAAPYPPPPAAAAADVAADGDAEAIAEIVPPVVRHDDLWQRIRAGFAMPDMNTPLVAEKERFYLSKPDALQRMFARGGRYLYFIVEELEKRGMPTELALLPFVESAMNPVALSPAQAAGLWQFIPATGKRYELSQNWWVDNRRDVVKSTIAALEYLQTIYEMHERDWFLALASYNWGENAVARAVQRNRAAGKPADYLSLRMPNETRHYVPKLIALKHIVMRADELQLALPPVPNEPYFGTVEKTRPIDLKLAARFAGMTVEDFVALNPAHNRPVIAATRNNLIRLPADKVEDFVDAIASHEKAGRQLASWQPYTLKPGDTLAEVSRRGGVTADELLQANGLKRGTRVLAGTRILVPQQTVNDEMLVEAFAAPRVYEEVRTPAVYHVVKSRDTLASVAGNYRIPVEQLRRWNEGVQAVKPGARLLVRPAATQTVLTTETGSRQVVAVARGQPLAAAPAAESGEPPSPVTQAPATAAPAAAAAAAVVKAKPPRRPASGANPVSTAYRPAAPGARRASPKPAAAPPKRPRT
jgi:membrane-bound lytic murein transglycosylase D